MKKLIFKETLVAKGIDLDDSTLYRKEKVGLFPRHVRVGNRRAWVESEIDSYIMALIAERDAKIAIGAEGNSTGRVGDGISSAEAA